MTCPIFPSLRCQSAQATDLISSAPRGKEKLRMVLMKSGCHVVDARGKKKQSDPRHAERRIYSAVSSAIYRPNNKSDIWDIFHLIGEKQAVGGSESGRVKLKSVCESVCVGPRACLLALTGHNVLKVFLTVECLVIRFA